MSISSNNQPVTNAWDRRLWMWDAIFYILLATTTLLAILDPANGHQPEIGVLAALLAGWYWLMILRLPGNCRQVGRVLLYFGVTIGVWVLLVGWHPIYYMLLLSFYSQIYMLLPLRRAIPTSFVLTGAIVLRQADPQNLAASLPTALIWMLITVIGAVFGAWIASIIEQSHDRQQLIEELEATRRELAAAERQTGVLEERQRLSGEIHDTLAQAFTSVVMHLEAADGQLPAEQAVVRRHLDQARRAARDGLSESRRLMWALRPEALEQAPLPEALGRLAQRWADDSGIVAELIVTGVPRPLTPAADVTLLRAAQESLANVRKHTRARSVQMTLSYLEDTTILDVQDDGAGFDPAARPESHGQGGLGLRTMRERVEQIGGSLVIESGPDDGTTVVVAVPL